MFLADSAVARSVDSAMLWIGGICLVLLVGITIVMVWFVLRYRADRNPIPTQIEGNLKLEITWIVIPVFLVLFMFFKGYEGFAMMRNPPDDSKVVEVQAAQWYWTFKYPDEGITSDKLYARVDQPVKLNLRADDSDVNHSFYLPAFRVKEDCVPGRENYLWFQADKEGTYNIFCAEYCGRDHSSMLTELVVLPDAEYDAWVAEQVALQNKPVEIDVAMNPESEVIIACDAPKLYKTYCISCHGPEGEGGLVENARDFTSLDGWKRGAKVTEIFQTLTEGIEGTRMRSFVNIPQWDRFALAHYVRAFIRGSAPDSTEDEIAQLVETYRLGEEVQPAQTIPVEEAMLRIAEEAGAGGREEE